MFSSARTSVRVRYRAGVCPAALALAVTGVIHGWKRNSLLSIGCGTLFYMVLVQQIFR